MAEQLQKKIEEVKANYAQVAIALLNLTEQRDQLQKQLVALNNQHLVLQALLKEVSSQDADPKPN